MAGAEKQTKKRRVAVIGAGASGLAALRVFADELKEEISRGSWEILCFEKRQDIGGIWLPDTSEPPINHTPETPLYDSLTTNLPMPIMKFLSYNLAPSTHLFPPAHVVSEYLKSYEQHFGLARFIRFNTEVSRAFWNEHTYHWEITIHPRNKPEHCETHYFDHIFITNGHYARPNCPNFTGLEEWSSSSRGARTYMHSMWYREPSPYQGLRVLVIGGGPSGNDLTSDISKVAQHTIQSVRSFEDEDSGSVSKRGGISHFTTDGFVVFENGQRAHVDRVLLATGYKYDFPFLPQLQVRSPGVDESTLYNSGAHIYPLARHMFPLRAPFPPSSAVFFGLLVRVAPLPLFEVQALLAVRFIVGRVKMDTEHELKLCESRTAKLLAACEGSVERAARIWHVLDNDAQFDYREELWGLAGEKTTVPDWTRKFYRMKLVLRDEWKDLVRTGEADSWVRGVGEGGEDEWVDLMYRVLRRAESRDK